MSHSEGNAKGRTVTLHIVSSLEVFIAKKEAENFATLCRNT